MEQALAAEPRGMLDETFATNLCSLFDLSAGDAAASKATLLAWAVPLVGSDLAAGLPR